jgi:cell division protein FtsX
MFAAIRSKVMLVLGGLLAIAGVAIKFLLWRNKVKDEKIDTLEQNAEVTEKVHEADIERVKFDVKQEQKVQFVNDESDLDKLDSQRKIPDEKNEDDSWDSVTR